MGNALPTNPQRPSQNQRAGAGAIDKEVALDVATPVGLQRGDVALFVLYGMVFETDISRKQAAYADSEHAKKAFTEIARGAELLAQELPRQRELVEKIGTYGFSKV